MRITALDIELLCFLYGVTNRQLAKMTGYTETYISLVIAGKKPITNEIDRKFKRVFQLDTDNGEMHEMVRTLSEQVKEYRA